MNKNTKILVSFIFLMICLNFYLLIKQTKVNKLYVGVLQEADRNTTNLKHSYSELLNRMFTAYSNEDIDLSQNNIFKNSEINYPILVVRYPHLACNTCMDSLMIYIPEILGKNNLDKVYIIVDNSNEQYMHQLKRLKAITFKNILSVRQGEIILPFDQNKKPYVYIINNKKKSDKIFIPERDKTDETKYYLNLVKKKLN